MGVDETFDLLPRDAAQRAEAPDRAGERPPAFEPDPGDDADRLVGREGDRGGGLAHDCAAARLTRMIASDSRPRATSDAILTRPAARRSPSPGDVVSGVLVCRAAAAARARASPRP